MKKIAYYIRVSTQEQANNWFWKDSQLTQLNKYTQYHFNSEDIDWEPIIYSDLGISGWKDEN
jgi:DNA invertase Pin-like site-specific DNA recombinase